MIYFYYIFSNFIKLVLAGLILCLALSVLFNFMHKTTWYFEAYSPDAMLIIQYYLFQMPFQVMQYLPLTTLIASVILMSTMSYYSETSVLRSFGVGPWKMMFPLLIGGFFLISCSFILSEWVVPYSAERAHYITEVLIEKKQTTLTVKKDFWTKKNNELLNYVDEGTLTTAMKARKPI